MDPPLNDRSNTKNKEQINTNYTNKKINKQKTKK